MRLGVGTGQVVHCAGKGAVVVEVDDEELLQADCPGKLAKCTRAQSDEVFNKAFVVLAQVIGLSGARPGEATSGTPARVTPEEGEKEKLQWEELHPSRQQNALCARGQTHRTWQRTQLCLFVAVVVVVFCC